MCARRDLRRKFSNQRILQIREFFRCQLRWRRGDEQILRGRDICGRVEDSQPSLPHAEMQRRLSHAEATRLLRFPGLDLRDLYQWHRERRSAYCLVIQLDLCGMA